jgi:hypothetical protein
MTRLLPRFVVAAVFASLFAASAWAGTVTPGLNLAWTDCGAGGTATKNFTCTVNTGVDIMFASFKPPAGINAFIGLGGVVDITSMTGLMPSWWDMATGGCRSGRLSGSVDFSGGPFTCGDPFSGGQGAGGIEYASPFDSTNFSTAATALAVNHARVRTLFAVPDIDSLALDPNTEYYAFKFTLGHQNSTGAGNCAGCLTHMCVVFNSLSVTQPAPVPDVILSTPLSAGSNQITYQGTDASCSAVPTKNKTWGQIKSLYR